MGGEPQNHSPCVLFHQEVQPDRQSRGLPEEESQEIKHSRNTHFIGLPFVIKWWVWRTSTLGPDCPGIPLAPSAPERPYKNTFPMCVCEQHRSLCVVYVQMFIPCRDTNMLESTKRTRTLLPGFPEGPADPIGPRGP